MQLLRAALLSLLFAAPAVAADSVEKAPPFDPKSVDIASLISCTSRPEQFMALAVPLQDPLVAVSLGWRPLPQANMFLTEYALNTPITVFGHRSDHIAFAGSSVMAILDLADPRPLAKELQLETAIDTPEKAMFGKELVSQDVPDPETGTVMVHSVVLNVSNVTSHPGKTLVGCTYSIDPLDEEEAPPAAAPPAPAAGSPPPAS